MFTAPPLPDYPEGMRAHPVVPRPEFSTFLKEEAGYHIWNGYDYIESDFVAEISQAQADYLAKVAEEMYQMCLTAVDKSIKDNRFEDYNIDARQAKHITESWLHEKPWANGTTRDPELYGRFDFCWDGTENAKFFEINADTPTTIYECSVVQWLVLEDMYNRGQVPEGVDQFNSLEEKVTARWAEIRQMAAEKNIDRLHISCMTDWKEDLTTTSYLEALAEKAGWQTKFVDIGLIGTNTNPQSKNYGLFYDSDQEEIKAMYKLMPWEHIYEGQYVDQISKGRVFYIEPPWKAMMSNKMVSAVLWEMYPDHPNLLPTYTTPESFGGNYVEKPVFGRISAGIKIVRDGKIVAQRKYDPDEPLADYSQYKKVYQALSILPEMPGMKGWRYQTGVWVVGTGQAAGMDLRIDKALVTGGDRVKFLAHYIKK